MKVPAASFSSRYLSAFQLARAIPAKKVVRSGLLASSISQLHRARVSTFLAARSVNAFLAGSTYQKRLTLADSDTFVLVFVDSGTGTYCGVEDIYERAASSDFT